MNTKNMNLKDKITTRHFDFLTACQEIKIDEM